MLLFNFNIYTGDNFGSNDAAITAVFAAILGAIVGGLIPILNNYFINKKETQKAGETLINEIYLLEDPIKNQIKSLESQIKDLSDKKTTAGLYSLSYSMKTLQFESINRNYVYKYFEKHSRAKDGRSLVNKVYITLEIIRDNRERIVKYNDKVIELRHSQIKRCKYATDEILRLYSFYSKELISKGDDVHKDELLITIFNLYKEYIGKKEELDVLALQDTYYAKLSDLVNKLYMTDSRAVEFARLSYVCQDSIRELLAINKEFSEHFTNIKTSIEEQYTILKGYPALLDNS